MNCQECESLFDDMIDRHVKEPTRRRMELHLSRCGTCRGKLEHRKRSHALMFRALNNADRILHLPKDFADRLVAECQRQPRSFFPALPRWALIAASLAIVAGFVFAATVLMEAVTGAVEAGGRGATALPGTREVSSAESSGRAVAPRPPASNGLDETIQPTSSDQPPTNQGGTTMTPKKAATAALAATMAAAPLASASGNAYQFILSGDPVAAATAGSSSASSATTSLTSGTLADGFVLASDMEARYRTLGESGLTALRSDDFTSTMIILR